MHSTGIVRLGEFKQIPANKIRRDLGDLRQRLSFAVLQEVL